MGDAVQGPLAGAGGEPADHEPVGALGPLHLAEDRLDGLATEAVEGPATLGQELALHALAGREMDRHAAPRRRQVTQRRPLPVISAGGDEQLGLRGLAQQYDLAPFQLEGNNNEVLYNLIRFSSQRGILIESFFDATLDQELPSSGNLIRGNLLTRNHTSGIHLPSGFNFGSGPILQADDTTIDANIITLNEGEGVSIPEGFDPPNEPAATNTTLTNNVFDDNRTDICNESGSTVIDASNDFTTGGLDTDCVVEPF